MSLIEPYQEMIRAICPDDTMFARVQQVLSGISFSGPTPESAQKDLVDLIVEILSFAGNLRRLHEISTRHYASLEEMTGAYLQTGCEILDLEIGIISEIDEPTNFYLVKDVYPSRYGIQINDVFELGATYCVAVFKSCQTITYSQVGILPEMASRPVYQNMHLESYIGTPIRVDDQIYGTLNFSSTQPRANRFSGMEVEFIEIMAQHIGQALESARHEAKRHKTEEKLRQREALLQTFVKHTPAAVAMFDTGMCYLLASERWQTDYNIQDQTILGRSHYDVFPEIGAEWKAIHQYCLQGNSQSRAEDFFERLNGSTDWIRWEIHPWYEQEQVGGIIMFTEVITERKQIEIALQRSQELYRTLARNLPGIGVLMFDTDMRYMLADGPFLRDMGFSKALMEGHTLKEVAPESSYETLLGLYRQILDGDIMSFERPYQNMHYRATGVPLLEEGEIVGGMLVVQDITEQKRSEDARRASEARYHTLVSLSPVGIFQTDKTGQCVYVNKRYSEITGISLEDASGMGWAYGLHPDDTRRIQEDWLQATANSIPFVGEYRFQHTDGSVRWVIGQATTLHNATGEVEGYMGVVTDISERKQVEEALQDNLRKLSTANKEIQRFAYIVSHDLRAPLVNLKGFSSILQTAATTIKGVVDISAIPDEAQRHTLIQALDEQIPTALNFISSSVERMDQFTQAILQLSRLGRLELHYETVAVETVVRRVIQSLSHQIEAQQIVVDIGALPALEGDLTAIDQIFGNIIANAVNYMKPGQPGHIQIWCSDQYDRLTYHIEDNGRGIAHDDFDKVFEPFRRAGKSTTPGEGMGLAYAHTLARRLGGEITFDSQLDVGTTFHVTLPKHLSAEKQTYGQTE